MGVLNLYYIVLFLDDCSLYSIGFFSNIVNFVSFLHDL